jgi:hypothetical protein
MTIWLLTLVLVGLVVMAGFNQGAIKASFSFVGLILGLLLAVPIGLLIGPVLGVLGVAHPWTQAIIGPVVAFCAVLIGMKVAGYSIHYKVETWFRYKQEQRFMRWERMNDRLGGCVGVLNGTVYLLMLMIPVHALGYLTYQLKSGEEDPALLRWVNRLSVDLNKSGLRVGVAAIDPFPEAWYDASDVIGTVVQNPLLQHRLAQYPAFLSLAERQEFRDMADDQEFNELFQSQPSLLTLYRHPRVQAVLDQPEIARELLRLTEDLKDLLAFLETGYSGKYGEERILGRWELDTQRTLQRVRQKNPSMPTARYDQIRANVFANMAGIYLIAGTDNQVFLKRTTNMGTETLATGQWETTGGGYGLIFETGDSQGRVEVEIGAGQLSLERDGLELVLTKEI